MGGVESSMGVLFDPENKDDCYLSEVTVIRTFSSIIPFLEQPANSSSPTPAPCTRKVFNVFFTTWMSCISVSKAPLSAEVGSIESKGNDFEAICKPPSLLLWDAKSVEDRVNGKSISQLSGERVPTNAPRSLRTSTRSCLPSVKWCQEIRPVQALNWLLCSPSNSQLTSWSW